MRNRNRSLVAAVVTAVGSLATSALAAPAVDGTLDAGLYTRFATQTVGTQFGDNQSELDAGYYRVDSGRLYLFLAGNVESNNNHLALFFDTRDGGQNTIASSGNPDVDFNTLNGKYGGFTFDTGFAPDYYLSFGRENNGGDPANSHAFINYSELNTVPGGNGGFLGQITVPTNVPSINQQGQGTVGGTGGLPSVDVGYNDANVAGIDGTTNAADQAAANAVTTGTEFAIDLAALGITGDFKISALINGSGSDYLSNQALGGFAAGQGNLGGDGTGTFTGTVGAINLNNFTGNQFATIAVTIPTFTYNVDANGNYSNPANFTGNTVPTGANGRVIFGPVITAPRTVTLDIDVSLTSLTFNNANAYTIAGAKTLTIAGNPATPAVTVLAGSHVISAPVVLGAGTRFDIATSSSLSLTGSLTATGQNLFKQGGGTLSIPATASNSITVNAGTLKTTGTDNNIVRGVTVDSGATLDLTSSTLIVDYDDGFSPRDAIKAYVASGALQSSTITGSNKAIGFIDSAANPSIISVNGAPVDATTLAFRATLKGDTNIDRTVNFSDLLALAQNYGGTDKQWYQGDSNYDGLVNFSDLLSLAQNYNSSASIDASTLNAIGGAAFAADFALAQSLVPEPATLSAFALLAGGLVTRRRRA